MKSHFSDAGWQPYHTPPAELLARRWTEDRAYIALVGKHRHWLQASWRVTADHTALTLHWSRRLPEQQGNESSRGIDGSHAWGASSANVQAPQ